MALTGPSHALRSAAAKAGSGALAVAVICAGWAALAWSTELGGELFIDPGRLIADFAIPQAAPTEPFHANSANTPGEAVAQLVMPKASSAACKRGGAGGLRANVQGARPMRNIVPLIVIAGLA
jgi:hypothetical protein